MPLALHDVEDAERVVSSIVTRSGLNLRYHEREDLEQYLLGELWELSLRYDPQRGVGFGAWAATTLRKRVIDHQRRQFGTVWKFRNRTYTRQRPPSSTSMSFESLSPRGTAILRQIGTRILDGYGPNDIASALGISRSSVSTLLRELREELGAL